MSKIMLFAHECFSEVRRATQKNRPDANLEPMTFEIEPIYGHSGNTIRTGITIHSQADSQHQIVIGYRLKIGFPSAELRCAASDGITKVHDTIKSLFGIQNDDAWVLRDKSSNEVWFTFSVQKRSRDELDSGAPQSSPEQRIDNILQGKDMDKLFVGNAAIRRT